MTAFQVPTLFADFTGGLGTNSFILNGAAVPDFNTWLTTLGGTFSRGSTAYYTNSSGVVTQAGNNVLRFDYDPVTLAAKGILLEPAGTNGSGWSQGNFNSQWSAIGGFTITDNSVAAPDGTATASTFVSSSSSSRIQQASVNTISAGVTTISIYAKGANGGEKLQIGIFNGTDGLVISSAKTLTTSWARYTFTTTTSASNSIPQIATNNAASQTMFLWGFQMELLSIASSYIPTTNATASRSADSLTWPLPSNSVNAPNSLYIKAINNKDDSSGADFGGLTNAGDTQYVQFRYTNGGIFGLFIGSGSAVVMASASDPGNSSHGVALAWNTGDYAVSSDGAAPGTSNSNITVPALTQFQLLYSNNNGYGGYVEIAQIGFWANQRLTNAQLQILSAGTFIFDLNPTTLTNRAGKYFSRRDYAEWLAKIVGEDEESRREYELFVSEADRERNLTAIQRALRDHEDAATEFGASEVTLFNNLTSTNHIKYSEAKERLEKARKERDHQHFMEVVNNEWAKYNESKAK